MLKRFAECGHAQTRRTVLCIAHFVGCLFARLMRVFGVCACRHSRANLRQCFPKLDSNELNELAKSSTQENSKMFFETLLLWFFPNYFYKHSVKSVIGEEHIRNAQDAGNGVILVSPHLGSWEIFTIFSGRFKAVVLYKPVKSKWLNKVIENARSCIGATLAPTTAKGVKVAFTTLDEGGIVTVFPDQVPKGSGRVLASFFNTPAWTGTLVSRLAQKSNVKVIYGFAKRVPTGCGYEIYLKPAPEGIYSNDLQESVQTLNDMIAECVESCPEQYTWHYKRFKQGPAAHLYER